MRGGSVRALRAGGACALPLCAFAAAEQATLTVPAAANIFASGRASAFEGQLPPVHSFPAGPGKVITFTSVRGQVRWKADGPPGGPDGASALPHSTNIISNQGISGIVHESKVMFLVGVFLDDSVPTDPAPALLNFSRMEDFVALAPALRQTFFIGDGQTGTGSGPRQRFMVPVGATRLFLGFAEAPNFYGTPGGYADNTGSLEVSLERDAPNGEFGRISTVAGTGDPGFSGDGGPATAARLAYPNDVTTDRAWNFYIADSLGDRIRQVTPEGLIRTIAGAGSGGKPDDGYPTAQSLLYWPVRLALDEATGVLYFSEVLSNRVRKFKLPDGVIEPAAGDGLYGPEGDGESAIKARLDGPRGLAVDSARRLYLADCGNHKVRRVTEQGIIEAFAGTGEEGCDGDGSSAATARLTEPDGLAMDAAGNLYIADAGCHQVRKVNPRGVISTVAGTGRQGSSGDGGPATAAQLDSPRAVAMDAVGNLYVVERGAHRVRRITPAGIVTTLAGNGTCGYSGDSGAARDARLCEPLGVAVDAVGSVYLADAGNHRMRKVSYLPAVTPPVISTAGRLPDATVGEAYSRTLEGTGEAWPLTWSLSGGALPAGLSFQPETRRISGTPSAYGTFRFSVRMMDGLGQATAQTLELVVSPGALRLSPAALKFTYAIGEPPPPSQKISVSSAGGALDFTARASSTAGVAWLSVAPASAKTPADLTVSLIPAGLSRLSMGSYSGQVTVSAAGVSTPVPVELNVGLARNEGRITAVLNAASWMAGPVAPGGFVTIFGLKLGTEQGARAELDEWGQIANTLAGTRVLFDGIPAPVLYARADQLSVVVPYAVAGSRQAKLEVHYREVRSQAWTLNVAASAPGLFTVEGSGRGPGAILNEDFTLNTANNPAAAGSVVMLFACGAGETDPAVADGRLATLELRPQPRLRVWAYIGGKPAEVEYAGSVVGEVVGLLQINVRVPAGLAPSAAAPVVIAVGEATSQPGVTVAVR